MVRSSISRKQPKMTTSDRKREVVPKTPKASLPNDSQLLPGALNLHIYNDL